MRTALFRLFLTLVCATLVCAVAAAQISTDSSGFLTTNGTLNSLGMKAKFGSSGKMSPAGKSAVAQLHIQSIPYWLGAFSYQGTTYPYVMVGRDPARGEKTQIDNRMLPLVFVFTLGSRQFVFDGSSVISNILASPLYQDSSYTSGTGQFTDAVSRAEFFNATGSSWHNTLKSPAINKPFVVTAPACTNAAAHCDTALLFRGGNGKILAIMNENFLIDALNALIEQQKVFPNELPIFMSYNVFLYDGDDLGTCCTLGFHGAYDARDNKNNLWAQTYAWASWSDLGFFSEPIGDIHALSHELSEWMNDPFIINVTPEWFAPGYGCDNILETGDPIVGSAFPITMNGYTYHPQNEVLLQWFARQNPSSAIGGAYTYPDTTVLTSPATNCPAH